MPAPDRRSTSAHETARERVAARRAAMRNRPTPRFPRRLPLILAGVAGILILVFIGIVWSRLDQTAGAIQQDDPRRAQSGLAIPGIGRPIATPAPPGDALREPVNILLIGVDKRPEAEEGVRSDTLILVRLEPQQGWASMLSIPRDSVVNVPNLGQSKINAAYTYGYENAAQIYGDGTDPDAGGGALAAETVEQFLGVKVDYVAQVDFNGFQQLVEAVGGVTVDVPAPLLDAEFPTEDYGVERIYIPAGLQVMDGRTALTYARSRHSSNDFDRGARQQQVLRALLDQIQTRGLLENTESLAQWADILAQNVRTTMPIRDLRMIGGLTNLARQLDGDRVVQMSLNPDDVAVDYENGSDIHWNQASVRELVARWQAGPQAAATDAPTAETARVQVLNGAAVDGVAGQISFFLSSRGFEMTDAANAPQIYPNTLIIDYTDRPETRTRLIETLGLDAQYVQVTPAAGAPLSDADIVVVVGQDYKREWVGEER